MNWLVLLWETCIKKLKDEMRAEYKRADFKGSVADIFGAAIRDCQCEPL